MKEINSSFITSCIDRDERALYELYRHTYSMMKGVALRYVYDRSKCDEVVNAGFLKIVKGLGTYNTEMEFMPWAKTVMIRVAIDHVRKIMRSSDRVTDYTSDNSKLNGSSVAHNLADLRFDAEELLEMLYRLPEKTRIVFSLFAIDGYTHKEISDQLSMSSGTSKWHVSKARQQLQAMISQHNIEMKSNYESSN